MIEVSSAALKDWYSFVPYKIRRGSFTFHLALHRYLALFISQAVVQFDQPVDQVLPSSTFLANAMDFPLKALPPGLDLKPSDPEWIGAWWLGHFFGGILILLSSCALVAYPRSMPGAQEMRRQARLEGAVPPDDVRLRGKLKDMIPATLNLLKNPTFMFNTLALTCSQIIATGLGPFVVKYLQAQFGVSTMKAGVASGITLIPGTAGGIFVGSYLMKKLKKGVDTCERAAKYCFAFELIAVATILSFLIPGCDPPIVAGIHTPYYNTSFSFNLTSACNVYCSCDAVQYNPTCGIDNITYFSPCQLGCTSRLSKSEIGNMAESPNKAVSKKNSVKMWHLYANVEYADCSCINPDLLKRTTDLTTTGSGAVHPLAARKGFCDRDCKNMIPFLCGALLLLMFNFVNAVPNKMVVMRCVPDNERAYALGVQWIFLTLLGAMPGPVLFGIFIDKSCDLWEETCHGHGNCLVYDNKQLSYLLAGAIILFQVLGSVFYFISWKLYKPVKKKAADIDERRISTDSSDSSKYQEKLCCEHRSTECTASQQSSSNRDSRFESSSNRNSRFDDFGSLTASDLTETTFVDDSFGGSMCGRSRRHDGCWCTEYESNL